ncbi:MAG: DNA internalization-related competence protein ComEC/Rec2 [Gammaproteobacteria bacterium]|nr:DNA internalization-related competence protein ComEC/Rec2 [Gammaproteobacteria bacterium]
MMQLASIGFLAGILIFHTLADLPSKEWGWLLLLLIPLAVGFKTLRPFFFIIIGLLYSLLIANDKIAEKISPDLETRDLLVTGMVAALPNITPERTRFLFQVVELSELSGTETNLSTESLTGHPPRQIQLSWYAGAPALVVGQQWQLVVRLKRPHGFSNPGGFDYESWLYQQDIHATGYVKNNSQTQAHNILLGVDDSFHTKLNQLRSRLSEEINSQLPENPMAGMIAALVVGDRQDIDNEQWRVLTGTGTNHLMAISGLHIGLVAGLVFLLISQVWRRLPNAALYLSAPKAAASGAVLAALGYAALAGFALPTQRALVMVSVAMLAIWLQRPMIPSQILAIALFAVLLYDPSAVINGSFWLSFGAVAIIFYTMTGRLAPSNWWWKWGRIQWMIGIGLAPILLFWFQQVPLVSPVANLIAVPLVSFITIPLSLVGGGLLMLWPDLAHWALVAAALTLETLWPLLEGLSQLDQLLWMAPQPPGWTLLPAGIGLLWLMAPRGIPARWAGGFWMLPLVFFSSPSLEQGMARFTLLDVGQGLAAVVQTANHVLIYDSGPRFSEQFDAGSAVIVPFLRHRGIALVDRIILSHNDIDHTGGFEAINRQVPVRTVTQSSNMPLVRPDAEFCTAGTEWNWDGVVFKVIHPSTDYQDERDNNMSCVVQIITQTDKLLLTGDMERPVEARLVKYFSHSDDNLRADILVVPHHGSRSSSSEQFVRAVTPKYALFSVGYRNHFGLPKGDVVERYQRAGATVLNTDTTGAITFVLGAGELVPPALYRVEGQRFWSKINH